MSTNKKVPSQWLYIDLESIAEVNPKFDRTDYSDDLDVSFIPMKNVSELTGVVDASGIKKFGKVKKGYTPFKDGDIIFAKITPCMENGKISILSGLANGIGFGSTEFHVLRVPHYMPNKYIFYYLLQDGFRRDAARNMTGSVGQKRVPADYLKQTRIPIPPLPEQHRIVAKIEELFTKLDAGVEALKQVQARLKRYRQSVLKAAVEGRLTTEWREQHKDELEPVDKLLERILDKRKANLGKKYNEPLLFNSSDLPELPEEWVWASLEQVARFKNGINFTKDQKGDVGIPTIDVYNMYSAGVYVDTSNLYKVKIELDEDYILHYGDILFVRSSVKREGVGWASTIKEDEGKKISFCGFIIRARLETEKVIPEFLTYFFRSANARRKIINASSQVTITNINQKAISRLLFPLMSMTEQQIITEEIERLFSLADGVEKSIEHMLNNARSLRQSILKRAFEGKLVPQDPNCEPASVLLERIKAEKAIPKKFIQMEVF